MKDETDYKKQLKVAGAKPDSELDDAQLFNRGVAKVGTGDLLGAKKDFMLLAKRTPSHPYVAYALAQVYEKLTDRERAIYFYKKALNFRETQQEARQALSELNVVSEVDDASARIVELKPVQSDITFKDVVGLDDVKLYLFSHVVLALKKPELFLKHGKKQGVGVLLYGPPGTGKTLIARAVAGEADAYMLVARIQQILGEFVGVTEKNLHAIFEQARMNSPCLIFMDELDALGGKRSTMGGSDEHGGCLIGDERILLGDGTIRKIEDFGRTHLERINLDVLQGYTNHKVLHSKKAKVFHKYMNQPIIEIITETGKSIKGTPNHPLLTTTPKFIGKKKLYNYKHGVLDKENPIIECDGYIPTAEWKRLDQLKVGDKVKVVTKYECTKKDLVETNFKITTPMNSLVLTNRMHLPKYVTPELGAYLGYILGDGWLAHGQGKPRSVCNIISKDELDILPKLVTIIKNLFGIDPIIFKPVRPAKRHFLRGREVVSKMPMTCLKINSTDLAENLHFVDEKRVPQIILNSRNDVVCEFLKWLFTADGCVEISRDRTQIRVVLTSAYLELLRDIQLLMLRFGICAHIIKRSQGGFDLKINRGKDVLTFKKVIGFACNKKIKKLDQYASIIPNYNRFFKDRQTERIVEIRQHPSTTVYDIEVPKSHYFIANGIVSHNTASMKVAINQFLTEMNGMEKNPEGIFVLTASNRPWDIDPALKRSGRLGDAIYVGPPNKRERLESFKYHLKRKRCARINFERLARATVGYSQADIEKVCDDATLTPLIKEFRTGRDYLLTTRDILKVISKTPDTLYAWYLQTRQEIIGKYDMEMVDKQVIRKWRSGNLEAQEKVQYKRLIQDILKNTKPYVRRSQQFSRWVAVHVF